MTSTRDFTIRMQWSSLFDRSNYFRLIYLKHQSNANRNYTNCKKMNLRSKKSWFGFKESEKYPKSCALANVVFIKFSSPNFVECWFSVPTNLVQSGKNGIKIKKRDNLGLKLTKMALQKKQQILQKRMASIKLSSNRKTNSFNAFDFTCSMHCS